MMAAALALFCVSYLMCFISYINHNLTFCEAIFLWLNEIVTGQECSQTVEIFLVCSRYRIWLSNRIVFNYTTTFNSMLLDVTRCVILHKLCNNIVKLKKTQILKWVLLLNSPKIMLVVLWNDITLFRLSLTSVTFQSAFCISV